MSNQIHGILDQLSLAFARLAGSAPYLRTAFRPSFHVPRRLCGAKYTTRPAMAVRVCTFCSAHRGFLIPVLCKRISRNLKHFSVFFFLPVFRRSNMCAGVTETFGARQPVVRLPRLYYGCSGDWPGTSPLLHTDAGLAAGQA